MLENELSLKWEQDGNVIFINVGKVEWTIDFSENRVSRNGEVLAYYHAQHPEPFNRALREIQDHINSKTDKFVDSLADKVRDMRNMHLPEEG